LEKRTLRLYGRSFEIKESERHEIELPVVSVKELKHCAKQMSVVVFVA